MMSLGPPRRLGQGAYAEPTFSWFSRAGLIRALALISAVGFVLGCMVVARVEPAALLDGLPRLFKWAATAWPPNLSELDAVALRAAETVRSQLWAPWRLPSCRPHCPCWRQTM